MPVTPRTKRGALREWVLQRNAAIADNDLRDDTPLVADRLVTSLQVIDLLLFIESLRQQPVEVHSLNLGAFQDIDTICRTFFPPED